VHYQGHSPNVLLLHSICGVATNLFPMPLEKLPQLAAILTKVELMHGTEILKDLGGIGE